MSNWQPIETAPKDRTVIDLWAGGERYANCFWDELYDGYASWRQQYAENTTASFEPFREGDGPAHWMPLPMQPDNADREGNVYTITAPKMTTVKIGGKLP